MSKRGALLKTQYSPWRLAIGAHHVWALADEPPAGAQRCEGWWGTVGETLRWVATGSPSRPSWVPLGAEIDVVDAGGATILALPPVVARHLTSLAVVRLFRDQEGLGYVIDPRRLGVAS